MIRYTCKINLYSSKPVCSITRLIYKIQKIKCTNKCLIVFLPHDEYNKYLLTTFLFVFVALDKGNQMRDLIDSWQEF